MIPIWPQEGREDLTDPRSVWDWVNYNIKKYSRKYDRNKSKQRKAEEELVNKAFHEAHLIFNFSK